MTHSMLSAASAVAVLAVLTSLPAEAQSKRGIARAGPTAAMAAGPRRARPARRSARKLKGGGTSRSPTTAANIHALTVYLQWRKCLDNLLPKCP